jgi:hypothetical protein
MLAGLLQALVAPASQALATHNARLTPDAQLSGPGLTANDLQSLKQKDPNNIQKGKPTAYLNYVFFDKQFKFVGDGSGVKQVGKILKKMRRSIIIVLFIYCACCFILVSCYNCMESYKRHVKPVQLSGIIIEKDSIRNHATPTIYIKENNDDVIPWGLNGLDDFWNSLKVDDSIRKRKNSYAFQIIRKDTILTFYPVCGCCDTLK